MSSVPGETREERRSRVFDYKAERAKAEEAMAAAIAEKRKSVFAKRNPSPDVKNEPIRSKRASPTGLGSVDSSLRSVGSTSLDSRAEPVKKKKPVVSGLGVTPQTEKTNSDLAFGVPPADLGSARTLRSVGSTPLDMTTTQRIEELEGKLQEERKIREDKEKQIQQLMERVRVLEGLVSPAPSTTRPPTGGPLQKSGRKRRRGATRSAEEEETSDEEDKTPTRVDETTGMEVEVVEQKEQPTNAPKRTQKPSRKLPPVIVGGHSDWENIRTMMSEEKIKPARAKTTREGIKVFFERHDDFNRFRQKIRERGKEQYTFQLPQERKHHIVVRGLTKTTPTEKIQEDLQRRGIEAEVLQMKSRRNDQMLPLFLVKTGSEAIFRVKRLLQLDVTIESKNKTRRSVQCFRCQRWGHTQMHCEFIERCVKCGAEHPSRTCQLEPKEDQSNATCCNCGGRHPASFRGCSRCPESRNPNRDRPASVRASKRTLRNP